MDTSNIEIIGLLSEIRNETINQNNTLSEIKTEIKEIKDNQNNLYNSIHEANIMLLFVIGLTLIRMFRNNKRSE